jgi:hypothetical protein
MSDWTEIPDIETDEHPFDGQPVDVSDAESTAVATWKRTRKFDSKEVRWKPASFWIEHNSGGRKLSFEPFLYRKHVL